MKIKLEIEIPDRYKKYFEYLKKNFNLEEKVYLENIIMREIESRNIDLKIF